MRVRYSRVAGEGQCGHAMPELRNPLAVRSAMICLTRFRIANPDRTLQRRALRVVRQSSGLFNESFTPAFADLANHSFVTMNAAYTPNGLRRVQDCNPDRQGINFRKVYQGKALLSFRGRAGSSRVSGYC